ncbi:MAG TPA: hypothetical protein VFN30_03105 [Chitinophagaceae bacterium]|nr:hypothetical protein [Chitinophagaceae bacterium]
MQFKERLLLTVALCTPIFLFSQSVYLPPGSKHNHFIDRMEILQGKVADENFTTTKPYNRRFVSRLSHAFDSLTRADVHKISKQDEYNLISLYRNNSEWFDGDESILKSKKPFLKSLYTTKANFFEHKEKDLFIAINPVFQYQFISADKDINSLYLNSRGASIRAVIGNKIGAYVSLWDNQERAPQFVRNWIDIYKAVPGANFYKVFKTTGVDYFDGRGGITFPVTKYIDVQLAYDKNFIGNGYRSLFLSDWGGNYFFLKLNTKIWKFNYQNIFAELNPKFIRSGDYLLPKKYAAMHHLSINLKKWLNIGAFESVVFGRTNQLELGYLNPLIFYRTIEGNIGSPDNVILGFDFKANFAKKFQLYGQLLIDELNFKELRKDKTWWGNKFGFQLGGKYINAFNISNLDLQAEVNIVRPFTYSHYADITQNDFPVANYTHYNQPLAHPLGANFREVIGIARWQPINKLFLLGKIIYSQQGLDSSNTSKNFGSNIFRANGERSGDYGYTLLAGLKANIINASFLASYEIKENVFFDFSLLIRNFDAPIPLVSQNTKIISIGVRVNLARREYDF